MKRSTMILIDKEDVDCVVDFTTIIPKAEKFNFDLELREGLGENAVLKAGKEYRVRIISFSFSEMEAIAALLKKQRAVLPGRAGMLYLWYTHRESMRKFSYCISFSEAELNGKVPQLFNTENARKTPLSKEVIEGSATIGLVIFTENNT